MVLLFDKHRLIASPALAPAQPGSADEIGPTSDTTLTIGLVNNMPDAALEPTERQFIRLLTAAAGTHAVKLHCFSLPGLTRSQATRSRLEALYTDVADLHQLRIDALFVTGAEPRTASLRDEPFWNGLTDLMDWAKTNTHSTIWSCLAAHAAVLHLDGIERHRLGVKCSGMFDCPRVTEDWLTERIEAPLQIPHSRLNGLCESDLAARDYQVLTASPKVGVDIFAKQFGSRFIFFQGHPEYDALSLQREYVRDVGRFLAGEQDVYPSIPVDYFDATTEHGLASFQQRAAIARNPALGHEIPALALRQAIASETAGAAIFRNWLEYLRGCKAVPAARNHRKNS